MAKSAKFTVGRHMKSPARAAAGKRQARSNPWLLFLEKFREPYMADLRARRITLGEISKRASASAEWQRIKGGRGASRGGRKASPRDYEDFC